MHRLVLVRWSPLGCFATLLAVCLLPNLSTAQGTLADYERANSLGGLVRGKVLKDNVRPNWIGESSRFWYRNDLRRTKEFLFVDPEKGVRHPAFDHDRLAKAIGASAGGNYDGKRLPFDDIEFNAALTAIEFDVGDKRWSCDLSDYTCKSVGAARPRPASGQRGQRGRGQRGRGQRGRGQRGRGQRGRGRFGGDRGGGRGAPTPRRSPDGAWVVLARDDNVYVRPADGGEETQLTTDGEKDNYYSPLLVWSPDSKKVATNRVIPAQEHLVHYIDSSPGDQVQPKQFTRQYLKPGDRVRVDKSKLFDLETKKQISVSDELFPNPYQTGRITWRKDSSAFTFEYNERGHGRYRVIEVDANTGAARAIIDEDPKTFFDYRHKKYRYDVDDGKEIVWMSERDGWNHLYLYDGVTGKVKNQITKGEWVVRGVDRLDEAKRQVWFRASGVNPDQDPYFIHYYRINLDGTRMVALTEGDGNHTIVYSPDRKYIVDRYSRVDMAPVTALRRVSDGKLVMELEKADVKDLLATGFRYPEPCVAKARDGKTDIWGVIYRPTNFDANKSYPVIEDIYAGPQGSFVPKNFSASGRGRAALAELGFIVVKIDGLGTSNRSKAFHDVCWKNLGDAGLPDRILWMKAANKKYPYMDITRVGVYGNSAGAQNAAGAVLLHPEFYKVAFASCGCHDNRMDKIWWNELWMGYPIGPHYEQASNVTHAHKLQGKLMLMVGELDTNVDPASTMQVVNALIKADKDFDFLVVPGGGHGSGGPYGSRRRTDFLVRHLLGVKPPDRNKTVR